MSTHIPLNQVKDKRVLFPFSAGVCYTMRLKGEFKWLVPGPGGRLWIEIEGLASFLSKHYELWNFDLTPLRALANKKWEQGLRFHGEAAQQK